MIIVITTLLCAAGSLTLLQRSYSNSREFPIWHFFEKKLLSLCPFRGCLEL